MLRWIRQHLGGKRQSAFGAMLNGADELWHPTAVRGREDLTAHHQRTVPAPSPGDRTLDEGLIVLRRAGKPTTGRPG